jgi:hypothetical protein
METIKVVTSEQVKIYQDLYEKSANLSISANYLLKADAYLIYHQGKLAGAYTLNNANNVAFRYLAIFTDEARQQVLNEPIPIDEKSFIEIAAIAFATETPKKLRNQCYGKLMWHALIYAFQHNRKYILGGSVIPQVQRMQYELMSNLLYKANIDPSLQIVGNSKGLVMLYYTSRTKFLLKAPYLLVKKMMSHSISRFKQESQPSLSPA